MPYEIRHDIEGCSGYAVVLSKTGKIVTCHPDKDSALKHLAALEINVEEAQTKKLFMHGGSTEFKVEFNVGDCQGGWAVLKDGTGQVVGCHKTEAEANAHRDMLINETTDILGDEVRTSKSPNEYSAKSYGAVSFWDGVFFPSQKGVMGIDNDTHEENARFVSTYNSPPQKDGTESAGYGNRSAGTNPK